MMAIIERQEVTVAQIGRIIGISRQGARKSAKNLIERGYIEVQEQTNNSRDKVLVLTEKGRRFHEETLIIKKNKEENIKSTLGEEKYILLEEILKTSWF